MDKDKWISEKIATLTKENPKRSKDQIIAIAFSMFEQQKNKMQTGGQYTFDQFISPDREGSMGVQKPIERIVTPSRTEIPGKTEDKLAYKKIWYKDGSSDLVNLSGWQNLQRMNNYRLFMESQKPNMQGGGNFYDNFQPYFTTNPGYQNNQPMQNPALDGTVVPSTVMLDISDNFSGSTNPENQPANNPQLAARMATNQYNNTVNNNYDANGNAINTNPVQYNDSFNTTLFNPYGGQSSEGSLFALGSAIGDGGKDPQNVFTGIAAGADFLLGSARNFLGGYSSAKATREAEESFRQRRLQEPDYQYMQKGGKVNPAKETDDPRKVKAYQDSLTAYNRDISFDKEFKKLVQTAKTSEEIYKGKERLEKKYPTNKIQPIIDRSLRSAPTIAVNPITGYKAKDSAIYKKPQQPYFLGQTELRQTQIPINGEFGESFSELDMTPSTNLNVRIPANIPQYYDIIDSVNQNFGGSETRYRTNDLNSLRELAPEPYNSRRINPVYQAGGQITNADLVTGAYLIEEPQGNVEIEDGEHVQHPDGMVQEAVGDKHSRGGIDVSLENGAKVLSDFTKIGGDNAKYFRKEFDIDIKASHTFADVLDKVNKKLGLKKVIEEESNLIEQVGKQSDETKDANTQDLNLRFLQKKLQEVQIQKQPLLETQSQFFDEIFERQERMKGVDGKGEMEMQEGGMTSEVGYEQIQAQIAQALQQGIPPEQIVQYLVSQGMAQEEAVALIQEIINQDQEQSPMMQTGGRVGNRFENPDLYTYQPAYGQNYYGQIYSDNTIAQAEENARLHPELYNQFFPEGRYRPADAKAYQTAINQDYDNILASAQSLYANNPEKLAAIKQQIEQDRFLQDDSVRGIEGKYGNYTATRPNFQLEVLPTDIYTKVNSEGINTASQLKNKYPDLYKEYIEGKNLKGDFWLGEVPTQANPEVTDETAQAQSQIINRQRNRVLFPALPSDFVLPPDSLQLPQKFQVDFGQLDPAKVSVEPNLVEIERQRQGLASQLAFLPEGQRAAVLASSLGQTQASANEAISKAEQVNAQARVQADTFNLNSQAKEDLTNIQLGQDYEQKAFRAMALTNNDVRNYFNHIGDRQRQNWMDVNNLNLLNQMSANYKTDGSNVYFQGQPLNFSVNTLYPGKTYNQLTDSEKKIYNAKYAQEMAKQAAKKNS